MDITATGSVFCCALVLLLCLCSRLILLPFFCNYSGMILVQPAAGEEKEKEARTPRAPARGLRPPGTPCLAQVGFLGKPPGKGFGYQARRATIKAHPSTPHPARPYGLDGHAPKNLPVTGTPCWVVTFFVWFLYTLRDESWG